MSTREVAAIAIKLLAIWLVLEVFLFMPAFMSMFIHLGDATSPVFMAGLVATYFTLGLFLAFILFRTSNSVLRTAPDEASDAAVSEGFILQVAGAFFVMSAFEGLAGVALSVHKASELTAQSSLYLVAYLVELSVGIAMLTGREHFVSIFRKLRGRA